MYAGHVVAVVGVALWVGTWWPLLMLPPLSVLATNRLVIAPEEDYPRSLRMSRFELIELPERVLDRQNLDRVEPGVVASSVSLPGRSTAPTTSESVTVRP